MSRILLADDSPHAQRMGERILREEGYEVVTVTDGNTALMRMADVDPDVVFVDVSLPHRSGYEICQEVKSQARHKHVRVILTAGLLEPFDEAQAAQVKCDGVLKKPFESSVVLETVKPLLDAAKRERAGAAAATPAAAPKEAAVSAAPRSERPATPAAVAPEPPPIVATVLDPIVRVSVVSDANSDLDTERVRAAVTIALDAAMPTLIDKITEQVLQALKS